MAKKKEIPDDCLPKCATCVFGEIDAKEGAGFCHRLPPMWAAGDEIGGFTFAVVDAMDWCGEYKRRCS